jgi:transcriptional regulator with XRE-family HTH domain
MSETTAHRDRATFTSATYLATLMAELDRAKISERIRLARKQAGFRNRHDLADVLQVHWRTVEDWENPKHQNVPWDRMQELADVLNVEKHWLLHGDPEPRPGADAEALTEIARRLGELEAVVQDQGRATTASVDALARDLRALTRRLGVEDGGASRARGKR